MQDGPHSREAEEQVLGCLLLNNEALDRVVGTVRRDDLYFETHRRIFGAITGRIGRGELANPVTLRTEMTDLGDTLMRLAGSVVSVGDVEGYAGVIADCARRRELLEAADSIRAMAISGATPDGSNDVLAAAQGLIGGMDAGATKDRMLSLPEFAARAIDQTVAAQDGRLVGHKTGLRDLDSILGGLNAGSLYILAGRTSMGKSGVAISIAEKVARTGVIVGFFSHEMSGEEIGHRSLSSATNIPSTDMRRSGMEAYDVGRIIDAMATLPPSLYIRDRGVQTIPMTARECRRLQRRGPLGMVVVDYLQLISATGARRGDNRVNDWPGTSTCPSWRWPSFPGRSSSGRTSGPCSLISANPAASSRTPTP